MQMMQKLVEFSELATLQIDQIYKMFVSLLMKTKDLPDQITQFFICPHTVICTLEIMEFEKRQCHICSKCKLKESILFKKKFQLSGILFFLLGGLKQGEGKVDEFYVYNQNFFSSVYGILSEELLFRQLCVLINITEYEKKKSMYQKIKMQDNFIQPQITTYELKRFCIIIVDPGLGSINKINTLDEKTIVASFKTFMEQYEQLLKTLGLRLQDFKICIHNLFQGPKQKTTYFNLKFNLFYDYICKCPQNKFSNLFYEWIQMQNYQRNSQPSIRSLANDVHQLSNTSNEENDFIDLKNLLDKYYQDIPSLVESSLFIQNISFFSKETLQQLMEFQTEELLWKGYKILFQQEIVELLENLISKNGNLTPSQQLFDYYQFQIQNIQEFNNYQSIQIFTKIIKKYAFLIGNYKIDESDKTDYINQSQFLCQRIREYELLKQSNTFQEYKKICQQTQRQPIIQEINYKNIQQYEEDLKDAYYRQQRNEL